MRRILFLVPFMFLFHVAYSSGGQDSLFAKLNSLLDRKKSLDEKKLNKKKNLDEEKLKRIDKLQENLNDAGPDLQARYRIYTALYQEYKSFNYNEAFHYAQKLQQTAYQLKDPKKIDASRVKFGFIFLSSGMFKEVFDSLRAVNVNHLDTAAKKEYYLLLGRTYYDLSDYDKENYYTPIYNDRAGKYIDSATSLCKPNSFEYIYYTGLKFLKTGNITKAITNLKTLISSYHLPAHEFAITASTLSDIYIRENQPDSAINLLIQA